MNTTLVSDALSKVWCNPYQDTQYIVKPTRVTPAPGVTGTFDLMFDVIALPTAGEVYHVYQMGQISPQYLNLSDSKDTWISATELMRTRKLTLDIHTNEGVMVPRFEAWVLYNTDHNLLVAIRDQKPLYDLGRSDTPVYWRFYSNAWYQTTDGATAPGGIYSAGVRIKLAGDSVALQNTALPYQSKTGAMWWYLNGKYVDNIPPNRVAIGDTVEFVFDASVRQVLDVPISTMRTFDSTLDSASKYLIHNPLPKRDTIDYLDDIDFYLINPGTGSTFDGVYFHKNLPAAVRQLTQQDYSVPTDFVSAYAEQQSSWGSSQALTMRLFIRNSGYHRPLVFDANRIFELYKLSDEDILEAMVGTNSTLAFWRADTLESSAYVKLMGASFTDITQQLVQDAYGYNAISKLTGDSPLPVVNTTVGRGVVLPYDLQNSSTIYEYDTNRVLIGVYNHEGGDTYYPNSAQCTLIEGIVGKGSIDTGIQIGSVFTLNPSLGQRIYVCGNDAGQLDNEWQDVTGNTDWYTVDENNNVVWAIPMSRYFAALKSDDKFLSYQFQLTPEDDLLTFNIEGQQTFVDGVGMGRVTIPYGALDLWLNGSFLIEGIDYVIQWPTVVICNKTKRVPGTQTISIRGTGFCDRTMQRTNVAETGFVTYGVLSRNRVFDIRDDKVMRVVCGGKLYLKDELIYSEDNSSLVLADIPNGTPYALEEIVVPLRDAVNTDTYALRDVARLRDSQISGYLTPLLPDAPQSEPSVIPAQYEIFSPFAAKVMWDLKNGILSMANFMGLYNDAAVQAALASYTWLLEFDPIIQGYDKNYVRVLPHPESTTVALTLFQYRFLQRAIKVFLKNEVNISQYVTVSG